MPQEVQQVIKGILEVLDEEYGADRDKYEDDGGDILVVERKEDFEYIKDKTYIDYNDVIV